MEFYEAMQYIMHQKGITHAELSRRTGLSRSLFSELKAGRTKDVSWSKALLIIDALGVTPNEFAAIEDSLAR